MDLVPPISGSCLCGQVRYCCNKRPIWSVNCHCRSCQKLSGAPFVSAFTVPDDSYEISGATVCFTRVADSGNLVTTTHCANCGSRVHAQSAGAAHLMNFFATTLAEGTAFTPIANVFVSEAADWIEPPVARFNFPGMPRA